MNSATYKWCLALEASFALHAGVAYQYDTSKEETSIEGGAPTPVATLGSAFADTLASGSISETIEAEPVTEPPVEPLEMTDFEKAQEVEIDRITPVEDLQELTPVHTAEVEPVTVVEPEPTPAKPATEQAAQPEETEPLQPAEQPLQQLAALIPDSSTQSVETPTTEPMVPDVTIVPVPEKRKVEKPVKPAKKKKVEKPVKPAKTKKVKKPTKKKTASGNQGKSKSTNKAGSQSGQKVAKNKNGGKKKRLASLSGNSEVSNYPGKIVRKLRRSLRYPKAAQRKKIRGQVMVSFVVCPSSWVSGQTAA